MKRHAVIMAGGRGTRFWPASRAARPKQLLDLWGEPMIRSAARRLIPTVAFDDQWVITGADLVDAVAEILPELPRAQLIAEPVGRNTAPCIGLAAVLLEREAGEEAVFGVFPSDHYIPASDAWTRCLNQAFEAAQEGAIVTLGVQPTRPETGYGYIKLEGDVRAEAESVYKVERFVEKPDHATALQYLGAGSYLWNAGIFFFRTSTILREIERQLPDLHAGLERLRAAWRTPGWASEFAEVFQILDPVSIDYGVMEGAEDVRVVPASFHWSDVGHWGALGSLSAPDAQGNVSIGDVLSIDARDSVLVQRSEGRLLAAIGVEDLAVVDSNGVTMVCPRDQVQRVRELVAALEAQGRDDWL